MKLESGPSAPASFSSADRAPTFPPRETRPWAELLGLACLIACLLLMSMGVRTVKAEGEALMSVDPQRVEAEREKGVAQAALESKPAPATAKVGTQSGTQSGTLTGTQSGNLTGTLTGTLTGKQAAGETRGNPQAARDYPGPGVPAIEVQPGVVVLNTRGFNYGPPPAVIDPAAMRVEKDLKPGR